MPIEPGTTLGPYEIVDLLGAGGMGEVYRARDRRLEREVAIKVLSPHLTARPDILERFEREAKVVASLSHPNIVAIFDVGHADDLQFVVTELLEGRTLREEIRSEERLEWRKALKLALDIAKGLAAAHARGITHRDIKPENIFLTEHGPKILDFGLARLDTSLEEMNRSDQTVVKTPTGYILGTVGYMSPEQTAGEPAGPPSDVFSLGCVIYELLSGSRPFTRKTAAETMHAIMKEPPRPLPTIDPSIQDDLESLVLRSLEKGVAARFSSAAELATALDALLRGDHEALSRQLPAGRRLVRQALAVLDLEADDEDVSDAGEAIAEELQHRLANETELSLVARSRIKKLSDRTDPEEAAASLGASLVLAGSVRRTSDLLLVQMELLDIERGAQTWSCRERIRDATDGSIQRLVDGVINSLHNHLPFRTLSTMKTNVQEQSQPDLSSDAIEMLGAVRGEIARGNESGYRRAIEILERAVSVSPDFALAHAKLSETRLDEMLNGFVATTDLRERAIAEAVRAEALNRSAETLLIRARALAFLEWRWKEAISMLSELEPSSEVLIARSEIRVCVGERDQAVVDAKQAVTLDAVSPGLADRAARVLYYGRRWIDSQEQAHRALIQRDSLVGARIVLALSLARQGVFEQAHDELLQLTQEVSDYPEAEVALGELYGLWGKKAGAAKIVRKLDNPPRPRFVPQVMVARIESSLGRADEALDRLEEALQQRDVHLAFVRADPAWDAIRGQGRFREIEAKVFGG